MLVTFVLPGVARNPIGGYKVVFEYANALATRGHRVRLVSAWEFAPGYKERSCLRRGRNFRSLAHVLRNSAPGWFSLRGEVEIVNRFRARHSDLAGSDVVIATAATTAVFVAEYCKSADSTGVYFIQHYEDWSMPVATLESTWRLPLHRIAIAPWLVDVGATLNVSSVLVPNAIDSSHFKRGPAIADRPVAVSAMLSPMPFKRADLICEMFDLVRIRVPGVEGVAFGVGPRPKELPEFVRYVQRPSPSKLWEIYCSARVYVCASDGEGWHLPPAEAMLSGSAVVSTDIGGVRAYASESGVFVPTGDSAALAEAVANLLLDPNENERRAVLGHELLAGYSPEDAADQFERAILHAHQADYGSGMTEQ